MLHSVRDCKENATSFLKDTHIGGPLLLLLFLLAFSVLGTLYLLESLIAPICLFFSSPPLLSLCVVGGGGVIVAVLLLFPLWRGVNVMLLHAFCYGTLSLDNILFFFRSKKRYFYALRHTLRFLMRAALYCVLFFMLCHLGSYVGDSLILAEREAVALLILSLSIFFVVLLSFFFSFWRADSFLMDAAFLAAPTLSYRQLHVLSSRKMRQGRRALRRMNASFVPLFLLSALMAGLPLIFVIPYYVVARSCLAYRLFYC